MQLKVYLPGNRDNFYDDGQELVIKSEKDILAAGFAAARAVRAWIRSIPLVPSTGDLHFNIYAEMVGDDAGRPTPATDDESPKPKRKRKASK